MLQPQDFQDVLAVGRARSLKGAAPLLGVDPATVGRRLEAAEARLGARLFLRTARGLEPTPEGAEVMRAAERLEAIRLDWERAQLARPGGSDALTLSAAEWGVPLLTPVLVELARLQPALRLRLRIENRAADLARREADLALRLGRPTEKALAGKRVGVARYGLYAAPEYLAAAGRPRAATELPGHAFCALDATYARAPQVRWGTDLAGGARVVLETSSMLALVEAVRRGAGVAVLPCALAERDPGLERVLPELGSIERDLWIVYHRDLRRSRAVRGLVDALVERVRPLFAAGATRQPEHDAGRGVRGRGQRR